MFNILASENSGNLTLLIILLVACALMFVLSFFKNKKYVEKQKALQDELQIGSKVLTKTFIYGTVEKITDTTDGKVLLIKTGDDDKCGYIEMNIEGIYSVDTKEEVFDIEELNQESSEAEEIVEVKEEKIEEPVKEEKPKKARTKKVSE